jgi:hypothetical protein
MCTRVKNETFGTEISLSLSHEVLVIAHRGRSIGERERAREIQGMRIRAKRLEDETCYE